MSEPPARPHADAQALHEQRIRRLEIRQGEAERLLETFRRQIRDLRQRVGLPADPRER